MQVRSVAGRDQEVPEGHEGGSGQLSLGVAQAVAIASFSALRAVKVKDLRQAEPWHPYPIDLK